MLSTTQIQSFLNIITSNPQGMVPPVQSEEAVLEKTISRLRRFHIFGPIAFEHDEIVDHEKSVVKQMTKISFIGSKETVKKTNCRFKT